jgi:hypothetical protein
MGNGCKDQVRIASFCKVARAEEARNGDFTFFAFIGESIGKRGLPRSSGIIDPKYRRIWNSAIAGIFDTYPPTELT